MSHMGHDGMYTATPVKKEESPADYSDEDSIRKFNRKNVVETMANGESVLYGDKDLIEVEKCFNVSIFYSQKGNEN